MTNHADQWMTIREAALALDLSELTVRRRIKDGRLAHQLVDGKYFVKLGEVPGSSPRRASPPSVSRTRPEKKSDGNGDTSSHQAIDHPDGRASTNHGGLDLAALLQEHGRLSAAAGRATLLEEQLRALEERNRALQEGLVSLAGRNGWLESRLEEREQHIKLLSDGQRKRAWWRRLFQVREAGA